MLGKVSSPLQTMELKVSYCICTFLLLAAIHSIFPGVILRFGGMEGFVVYFIVGSCADVYWYRESPSRALKDQ